MKKHNIRYFLSKIGITIFAFFLMVIFVAPILWLIVITLKDNVEVFKYPPDFFFTPKFASYVNVLTDNNFLKAFGNSLIVASTTTATCLLVGIMAAYSVITFNFKGKKTIQIIIMLLRIAPAISLLIPQYMIFSKLSFSNTRAAIIIPLISFLLPFTVWMLLGYLQEVPKDLIYAALIDGCGYFKIMLLIVIPLSAPGIASVGTLVFAAAWNEYVITSVMASASLQTLPLLIRGYLSEQTTIWNDLAAAGVIVSMPAILVAVFFQKYIITGLTNGAVKG